MERPYHHYGTTGASSSSYVPRYNSSAYESSRFYSDSSTTSSRDAGEVGGGVGSRRSFTSRASSILEGSTSTTTRYHREESREVSITRRSTLADTNINNDRFSSIRENSILADSYQPSSRASMVSGTSREGSRDRGLGSTATSVPESAADFRNKYSPDNYVPKVMRGRQSNGILERDSMSRSKTLGDIGLPPMKITTTSAVAAASPSTIATSNNTSNSTNTTDNDENERMRSVSEIRRHFDRLSQSQERELSPKLTANKNGRAVKTTDKAGQQIIANGFAASDETDSGSGLAINGKGLSLTNGHNHTSDFASYIPASKAEQSDTNKAAEEEIVDDAAEDKDELLNGSSGDAVTPQTALVDGHQVMDRRYHHHPSKTNPANEISSSRTPTNRTSPDHPSPGAIAGGATTNYVSPLSRATSLATSSAAAPTSGLNGLKNIGNTCFMNSVLQCLSNTRPLLEYMRKDGYSGDINTTISGMKGALVKAFALLIKDLWSDECVVNTASLKTQIQRFAPRFMGYSQQDAQEFLRYLLEGLHEDVNRVTIKPTPLTQDIDDRLPDGEKAQEAWQRYTRMDNSKIVDLFVGQLKSTLKCTHCGHCSVTFDPFWDLSLPIPSRTGQLRLSQCLDSFTREETLDGDEKPTCSKCKERRKCTKSFSIQRFPKILVIHLKRFSPMERFRGKLSCTVDFPLEGLDMSNYAADAKSSQCRYTLYAISNHSGTTYSGHYTAYCKHPYTGAWHEYNDSRVSTISSRSLVSGEAYVLFYELDSNSQRAHL